jgi:hypothetical protein
VTLSPTPERRRLMSQHEVRQVEDRTTNLPSRRGSGCWGRYAMSSGEGWRVIA